MATVLGLHGGVTINQHEASACLIRDGKILGLFEEERYLRQKSAYGRLPLLALRDLLAYTGVTIHDIDLVVTPGVTYTDGFAERISHWLRHHFGHSPRIEPVHHQLAHCATAFYGSGFADTTVVSLDSTGDGVAGFVCSGTTDGGLDIIRRVRPDQSLGAFYTLFTHLLGFEDGDEYKVMGLAPYGRRGVIDLSPVLGLEPRGWKIDPFFWQDDPRPRSPFEPIYDREVVAHLLKLKPRHGPIEQLHKDLAWAVQDRFEAAYLNFLEEAKRVTGSSSLAISGGCALNCSANRKVIYQGEFKDVYISPVCSDRGLSLGCAYLGSITLGDKPDPLKVPYLGRAYSNDEILSELVHNGVAYATTLDPAGRAAKLLNEGKIIGWFQGRSEAGARALGNRSILAPPLPQYKQKVNASIKFREEFRPFAPAAVKSHRSCGNIEDNFYTKGKEYPTMSATVDSRTPDWATTHIDGTARLQTVAPEDNQLFYHVINQSNYPFLLNTSFNLRGQPIVESPRDAIATFFSCGLDALIIGDCVVEKKQ